MTEPNEEREIQTAEDIEEVLGWVDPAEAQPGDQPIEPGAVLPAPPEPPVEPVEPKVETPPETPPPVAPPEPVAGEPVVPPEASSEGWLQEKEALQREIQRLSSTIIQGTPAAPQQPTAPPAPVIPIPRPTPAPSPSQFAAPTDFVSEEEWEEAFQSSDVFNKVMGKVYSRAVQDVLTFIPTAVSGQVSYQFGMTELVNQFYDDNPDLLPHKEYVGVVANELSSRHTDKSYADLLPIVATEVRTRIGLSKKIVEVPTPVVPNPALPTGGVSGRPVSPKPMDEQERLIDATFD